jgi:hypothetical protein
MRTRHLLASAAFLFLAGLVASQCARREEPAPAPQSDLTAYVSIREVMTNIIDPLSDNVFDAVGVDVTKEGVVETAPKTDEDWAKVAQGAIVLAEGSNLLKIPRRVAPEHDNVAKNPGELPPDEIQKKIDGNRAMWNEHVDELKNEALKVLEIVKAKDGPKLFEAGNNIDKACERCHLEYWYPGDREAVERDLNSKAFQVPPKP